MMLQLQFKPTATARTWRNSSLRMHPQGRANMEATAKALQAQEGWHDWQIVESA